jgi:TRAP-type C4-dicarboxylate transport system substrate-binding protein
MQIKVAFQNPEADLGSRVAKLWSDLVTQRTGGRVTFQYFWGGSLLTLPQMFDGVRDGLADAGNVATAAISGKVPDVALLEVPFAFPLDDESLMKFQNEVNPILDEVFQKFNQKLVGTATITADAVTCKTKFLPNAQAWKGALVRTAGRWQAETLKAWGANPTVINLGDLYSALQRGTVDCTLLVYQLLDSFRIYEVGKHITRIDHSINYPVITMNLDVWKKLGPEAQKIILEADREATRKGLEMKRSLTVDVIAKFKKEGVQFCTPAPEELRRLRDATNQVWDQIRKEQGDAGRRIMAVAAKYRDKVTSGPTEGDTNPCPAR